MHSIRDVDAGMWNITPDPLSFMRIASPLLKQDSSSESVLRELASEMA